MSRLIWSPRALRDMQRVYRFLASKNPDAAKRAVRAIRQGVKVLGHQPHVGRPAQDMVEAYREWEIDFGDSGYVVRYQLRPDSVVILALRHQKEAGD
ncbi:type II toxin-antitoxin system RelE/ParE family toxin [Massilia genomosp. 1]|uniref:Type II toxin-antitoxin system RelE/ParE family toxin n=1 Tax=Massilia genomosp. 1 TaxID=2609280 RepID=A0ABX0MKT6_9BURK|nr:type II toxin-antitoxin system RelE/ParE family toxin [Massilia genomosp. 1]NHZ63405.1 type II toxin-antitoxin system RelE/ParE family toxin [Massilia genomosp. 1]